MKLAKPMWTPLMLTALIIVLDQLAKLLVVRYVAINTVGVNYLGNFFWIVHTRNLGIAFSIGNKLPPGMRRILFILIPVLVMANVITMLVILLLGIMRIGRLLSETAQESIGSVLFILLFFISIGGSFVIYNRIIKFISKKIDMDKYFHPIFRPRGRKPKE